MKKFVNGRWYEKNEDDVWVDALTGAVIGGLIDASDGHGGLTGALIGGSVGGVGGGIVGGILGNLLDDDE